MIDGSGMIMIKLYVACSINTISSLVYEDEADVNCECQDLSINCTQCGQTRGGDVLFLPYFLKSFDIWHENLKNSTIV